MAEPQGHMGDWPDEFFDEFYLLTYGQRLGRDQSRNEAMGAARLAQVEPRSMILDVPCGFGRHSLALASAGYRVVGSDRSRSLVAEADRRRGDAAWPAFACADYRHLPFAHARFDAVIVLGTSLGFLEDGADQLVLNELRRVLRSGGRLVIENVHRDFVARAFREKTAQRLPDGAGLVEERSFDPVRGIVNATHILFSRKLGRIVRSGSLRLYTVAEMVQMVERAGFADVACLGSLDGDELSLDTSLVVVAVA